MKTNLIKYYDYNQSNYVNSTSLSINNRITNLDLNQIADGTSNKFIKYDKIKLREQIHNDNYICFTNFKETIYIASDSVQADGRFVSSKLINGKPVIQNAQPLDFSITKNAFQLILAMVLLLFLFIRMARAYSKHGIYTATRGSQSFLEPLVVFVRDDIAKSAIGEKKYKKFLPFLLTIFFFIFMSNLLGLIPFFPGGANVTGNISVALSLAAGAAFAQGAKAGKKSRGQVQNECRAEVGCNPTGGGKGCSYRAVSACMERRASEIR